MEYVVIEYREKYQVQTGGTFFHVQDALRHAVLNVNDHDNWYIIRKYTTDPETWSGLAVEEYECLADEDFQRIPWIGEKTDKGIVESIITHVDDDADTVTREYKYKE